MATFSPRNKSFYRGKMGKMLMARAGDACTVKGSVTYPANQTKSRTEETWTFVVFKNCGITFMVRPVDVAE